MNWCGNIFAFQFLGCVLFVVVSIAISIAVANSYVNSINFCNFFSKRNNDLQLKLRTEIELLHRSLRQSIVW